MVHEIERDGMSVVCVCVDCYCVLGEVLVNFLLGGVPVVFVDPVVSDGGDVVARGLSAKSG